MAYHAEIDPNEKSQKVTLIAEADAYDDIETVGIQKGN